MLHDTAFVMQDFVKWRGPLLHRFLLALVDDSPRIRTLADYLLSVTLAAKVTPSILVHLLSLAARSKATQSKMEATSTSWCCIQA